MASQRKVIIATIILATIWISQGLVRSHLSERGFRKYVASNPQEFTAEQKEYLAQSVCSRDVVQFLRNPFITEVQIPCFRLMRFQFPEYKGNDLVPYAWGVAYGKSGKWEIRGTRVAA